MSRVRDQRYYSGFMKSKWWRGKRWRLYNARKGICDDCRGNFALDSMEIHHMVPRSKGGRDVDSNLKLLCAECHKTYHPKK